MVSSELVGQAHFTMTNIMTFQICIRKLIWASTYQRIPLTSAPSLTELFRGLIPHIFIGKHPLAS